MASKKTFFRKRNLIGFLLWLLVVLAVRHFAYPNAEEDHQFFLRSKIEGRITYLRASSGGLRVKIGESDQVYYLSLRPSVEEGRSFSKLASVGDSLYKLPGGDQLFLFTEEGRHGFGVDRW
ncbi:MAG: hypothetical protein AAFV95_21485 [Bacteroidota bacterium]